MAVANFTDASATINSVDLSDHVESIRLETKADMLENTAMGNTTHTFQAGLLDWSVEIVFFQDYAVGSVDATLEALVGAALFPIIIRPDSAAKSTTNPEYTGNGVLEAHQGLSGGVGTLQKVTARIRPAGALTRDAS